MKFVIFGSGGVGGYFGARLTAAGVDVTFIARGAHLDAMRTRGLAVASINGDFALSEVNATDDPAAAGVADVVLVCTKSWQVTEAAERMRPCVGPDTVVVPLLNGVEAPDQLAAVLGEAPVLGGLCRVLSFIEAPGRIRHAAIDPYIALGEMGGGRSERVDRVVAALAAAEGITAAGPDDIRLAMWQKFQFITAMSGIGAVTRAPIGETRDLPGTRRLIERVMEEVRDVANAMGIGLAEDSPAKLMRTVDALPAGSTASMQRDIVDGRPSELEAQNGAVVRLGDAAGVDTPVNRFVHDALLPAERRARGES